MNKHANHLPRGVTLLLALLCYLAVQAQPGLEYWFDGNYGDKVNINSPSAAGTFKNNINVKQLSQGFHTIYIRARGLTQDGHSPITSAAFFKYDATDGTVLEYWFDNSEARRLSTPIDIETENVQALSLDLSDIDRFPLGVHRLNIRVSAHGGNYSPVYTTYVLRMPEGSGDAVLEYWLDDDLDNRCNKGGNVNDLNIVVGSFISEPMHYADVRYKEGLGRYEYTEWIPAMVDTSAIPNRRDLAKANIPYVVLANAFSISMAELSAEAIKMLPTGRMIGERTFGAHGQSVSYPTIFHDGEFGSINGNRYVFTSSMQTRFVGEQRVLEGEGVSPTKTITQAEAGYEGAMEKAIDYIKAY